ncbi:MAG TPA: tRNA lysidine(34) synthetase TilS [Mesotoga infera]|uniref:tRNA(Ile)-lysidine synthase n=1 Tax=Mesotoga infera TaxID=1236046 RepID=A0A7C1GTD3_9BACT|nr:tRNA lysidine(34) synthetase TilS [Mesotoga infera]
MDQFELEVLKFIEKWHLIRKNQKILVAVSGGKDSMALLNILINLKTELGIELLAANLDHGLRKEGPAEEARMIEDFCRERSVPFYHEKRDVRDLMKKKQGLSVESAAREVRYGFLREVKSAVEADLIAIGHNRDDLVENILLRLARGTGMKGVVGLRPFSSDLIRPLLFSDMQRIIDYVTINRVTFMEDQTNSEDDFERNYVRLRIIPELKKMNPALNEAIWRFFENIYDGYEFIRAKVEMILDQFELLEDVYFIESSKLIAVEKAVVFEMAREMVVNLSCDSYPPSRERVLAFYDLLVSSKGRWTIEFGKDVKASRIGKYLFFHVGELIFQGLEERTIDFLPFACSYEKWQITLERITKKPREEFEKMDGAFYGMCSASRIVLPMRLRTMKAGDTIVPFGMKRNKKVIDVLSEKGLKGFSSKILVLENASGEILWIPGVVTSELCRVGPSSLDTVAFCLERR